MYDFHLHLVRLPHSTSVAQTLLEHGYRFNAVACEPWEWEALQKVDEIFLTGSGCYYGIHPMVCDHLKESDWKKLESILEKCTDAGVGETGLDKRYEGYEEGGPQEMAFRRQVKLALHFNRDLQIHCVGDYGRIIKILKECGYPASTNAHPIFHRFGGDISTVKTAQMLNPIFSLHQDSFRKKSTLAAIQQIPAVQIRFETDADETFSKNSDMTAEEIVTALEIKLKETEKRFSQLSI